MAANPGGNPGFTLAEDSALKKRLVDIAVSDDKMAERKLHVFFRHPEKETEKRYPYATIELLDINHAVDRQHSIHPIRYRDGSPETSTLLYDPSVGGTDVLQAQVDSGDYIVALDDFTPVDLMYQVTTYARTSQHDRQLTALILRRVFPLQGRGWLEIPEDGTIRRLDLLDYRSDDLLDGEAGYKKRIFRKVYTVLVNSEIPTSDFIGTKSVTSVERSINRHTTSLSSDPLSTESF